VDTPGRASLRAQGIGNEFTALADRLLGAAPMPAHLAIADDKRRRGVCVEPGCDEPSIGAVVCDGDAAFCGRHNGKLVAAPVPNEISSPARTVTAEQVEAWAAMVCRSADRHSTDDQRAAGAAVRRILLDIGITVTDKEPADPDREVSCG
jgi:hypothetical protein